MPGLIRDHCPWIRCIALTVALLLLVPGLVNAQVVAPSGGMPVNFPSPDETGKSLALRGVLWSTSGPARGAIVLAHGGGGWSDFREGHYGRALSAAGYAVLAIDSFGPRGVGPGGMHHYKVSFTQMAQDAFAARRLLIDRGISASRIAAMGLSKGGTGVLYAADRHFLPEHADRFPAVIALYPACHNRARVPKPASAVFIGLGEKDDLTGTRQCREIADAYMQAGGKIAVKIYPGSSHGFDGDPASATAFFARGAEAFTECDVLVEADGQETYAGTTYPPGGDAIIAALRKSCVRTGASFWTNLRQKEVATRDVIDFLNSSFPP
jgi:dienelactone hydrolase